MAQRRVNILGQGKIWVRVENLAQGTTAEDVQVSLNFGYDLAFRNRMLKLTI